MILVNSLLHAIILTAAGLCLFILFLPFHFSLRFSKEGNHVEGTYAVACLGIPLRKSTIIPQAVKSAGPEKRREPKTDEAEEEGLKKTDEKGTRKTDRGPGSGLKLFRGRPEDIQSLRETLPVAAGILVDLVKSVKVDVSCNLLFGLDDPADTAVLSGCLWSVASAAGFRREGVSLVPCFEGQRLEGWLVAELKARVLWLVAAMLRALKEKKTRRLMLEMARSSV